MTFKEELNRYASADLKITIWLGVFSYAVGTYFLATIYL